MCVAVEAWTTSFSIPQKYNGSQLPRKYLIHNQLTKKLCRKFFRMTKDKLIEAWKEVIIEGKNNIGRKGDQISLITNSGNHIIIENREPYSGGLYLEGLKPTAYISIPGIEEHELTQEEYQELVDLFNKHDKV